MAGQRVVIKKYENRRLYDTGNSRYVNLEDIARMVRQGVDVQVVDAATGEDLTRVVLTQIIVESAKEPDSGFPLDLLRQMIMASGNASKESILSYMQTMADVYQNAYRAFAPGLTPFNFFQSPRPSSAPQPAPPESPPAVPSGTPTVDDLHRRIEELERLVASGAHKAAKPKRAKKAARTRP